MWLLIDKFYFLKIAEWYINLKALNYYPPPLPFLFSFEIFISKSYPTLNTRISLIISILVIIVGYYICVTRVSLHCMYSWLVSLLIFLNPLWALNYIYLSKLYISWFYVQNHRLYHGILSIMHNLLWRSSFILSNRNAQITGETMRCMPNVYMPR